MNTCLPQIFDSDLAEYDLQSREDRYATVPLKARKLCISPAPVDEENLYTSFEAAISDRVIAIRKRLDQLSDPTLYATTSSQTQIVALSKQTALSMRIRPISPSQLERKWKSRILSACIALLLIMLGFDAMGLLVLYAH
jgi:hypothetical protein